MKPAAVLCLGFCCGCLTQDRPPGDEIMGTYGFHAEWIPAPFCGLPDISTASIDFAGTFSRFRDGGAVFLTLNGVPRDAGFDGQIATSTHAAARTFLLPDSGSCAPCDMKLVETLAVALLSRSQSQALGDRCPSNPLDGGVPGPDAGVTFPGTTPTGFDSVRACGELHEQIVATGACDPLCSAGCQLDYVLTGDRR